MVNKRHTQYGGGEGGIQRLPGGKSKPLSAAEEARVLRMKGVRAGVLGLDQMATADAPIIVPSENGPVESARTADLSDEERARRAYRKAEQARLDKNANKYNREVE
jgi:hypothetical protein